MVINKMKKILKSKKAFTLVETIGVLVIIGVLSVILIPVINNVIKDNKEKVYQSQLQNIRLAAKNFGSDNKFILPETEGESVVLTLGQLKKSGYLEESIINPKTKKEISNCTKIEIKKVNNNYEYILDESTIDSSNCNENFNSDIVISEPSRRHIKSRETSSYILIINPSEENQISGYNFDNNKLSLGDATEAKYSVVGENGIYKIVVLSGAKEEEISLVFQEGAITDSMENKIDTSELRPSTIIVDNTAPSAPTVELVSGNWSRRENDTWYNETIFVSGSTDSTIHKPSSTDARSGIDKYQISSDNINWQDWEYNWQDSMYGISSEGTYYRYIRAIDNAGNISDVTTKTIKIDKTAPGCNWSGESATWTKANRTITVSGSDSRSGMKSGQSSHNWTYSSGTTQTANLEYTVSDNAGNTNKCSKNANVYVDKEAPGCNWSGESATWTKENRTITVSGSDSGSGMKSGQSSYTWTYSSGTTQTANLGYTVSDNVGNTNYCSKNANIYVDKTAPTFSCTWSTSCNDPARYCLNCNYSEEVNSRYGHCYNIASNPNYSSSCNYNSLENRFNASSYNSTMLRTEYFGFDTRINSRDTINIKIQVKDRAGNTSTAQTYTYTQP